MTLDTLRSASFDALHALLREGPKARWPGGIWRTTWLMPWPDRPRSTTLMNRALFEVTPNGLDLDAASWWFVRPSWRTGRFSASLGPSRFLPASEIMRLEYGVSRLPRAVRAILYDEVQPLAADLMLGLGAIDRPAGVGEQFLFALTPAYQ